MTCRVCLHPIDPATAPTHPACEPQQPATDLELLGAIRVLLDAGLVTP